MFFVTVVFMMTLLMLSNTIDIPSPLLKFRLHALEKVSALTAMWATLITPSLRLILAFYSIDSYDVYTSTYF